MAVFNVNVPLLCESALTHTVQSQDLPDGGGQITRQSLNTVVELMYPSFAK
jgi:hypothetical protein